MNSDLDHAPRQKGALTNAKPGFDREKEYRTITDLVAGLGR